MKKSKVIFSTTGTLAHQLANTTKKEIPVETHSADGCSSSMGTCTMHLLPPHPDLCQVCGVDHDPRNPHNKDSMYYQMKWQLDHEKGHPAPTWHDAMAHCEDPVKEAWIKALNENGANIEPLKPTA